jgi:VWFA-related protein
VPDSAGVVPRQFLFYFDDARLLPWQRKPVIDGLRGFVGRLGPSDEASVVSYNGATNVLSPFTSSREALLDAFARLEKILPKGFAQAREFRAAVSAVEQEARLQRSRGRGGAPSDLRDTIVRNYSEEERVRSRSGLEELKRTLSALAGRPGRRRMLLVTTGWENVPGQTLAQMTWGPSTMRQFDTTLWRELEALLVAANRSGVSVDVVDAMGFEGELDVEQGEMRDVGPWFAMQNRRPGMSTLAEATGGSFVERSNSYAAGLETLWRDSGDYYSVGVTLPEALPAGKVLRVAVACTRPGVTLKTRTSVGARSDAEAARDLAESALLSPSAASAFVVGFELGAPRAEGAFSRRRVTPWRLFVPAGELTFSPDGDLRTAVVEVTIAAVDEAGGRSELAPERQTVSVPVARLAEAAGREVPLSGLVRTRPGRHRIVATVRDVASGRTAVASAPLVDE